MISCENVRFILTIPPFPAVIVGICTENEYERIKLALDAKHESSLRELCRAIGADFPESTPIGICEAALGKYVEGIDKYCRERMDLYEIPKLPVFFEEQPDEEELRMPIITIAENAIHEYTGLDFREIGELDVLTYRMYLADAIKLRILRRKDGKGKEYLNKCYDAMHALAGCEEEEV
ncbi:MAG: hypothetical protein ACI4Q6_09355 [Huintestinicola sp.]